MILMVWSLFGGLWELEEEKGGKGGWGDVCFVECMLVLCLALASADAGYGMFRLANSISTLLTPTTVRTNPFLARSMMLNNIDPRASPTGESDPQRSDPRTRKPLDS